MDQSLLDEEIREARLLGTNAEAQHKAHSPAFIQRLADTQTHK